MGAPPERDSGDEGPQRRVRITKGFYIDQYEVTATQFARFLADHGNGCPDDPYKARCSDLTAGRSPFSKPESALVIEAGKEHVPIQIATKAGAIAYCAWAGKELPSEAQWEFAAGHDPATGRDRLYPWGDEWAEGIANCAEEDGCADGQRHASAVGSFPRDVSAIGALDMGGNAAEWVRDCYQKSYPPCDGVCIDPVVSEGCEGICRDLSSSCQRQEPAGVLRGGSTADVKSRMWATHRDVITLLVFGGDGFRCVKAEP